MSKKNRTYYVSKNNSWHTYEFLERRQMDPKWRSGYISAKEQRKKEAVINFSIVVVLITSLVAISIIFNPYNRNKNTNKVIETTSISSLNTDMKSSNLNQVKTSIEQETVQDEQDSNSVNTTED